MRGSVGGRLPSSTVALARLVAMVVPLPSLQGRLLPAEQVRACMGASVGRGAAVAGVACAH